MNRLTCLGVALATLAVSAPAWAGDPFVSGTYRVQVDQWTSTWMLRVEGSEVSGASEWTCCPTHRVDLLSGRREGSKVTLRRDCSGQGGGACTQTYVGEIRGNQVVGTWSGTGGGGDWTLELSAATTQPQPQQQPPQQQQALPSGKFRVQVDRWTSTWDLKVTGNEISGTSEWTCCPAHRVDAMSGRIEGTHVVLKRDCGGQGQQGECTQTYVGDLKDGKLVGTWGGTGGRGSWTLYLQ